MNESDRSELEWLKQRHAKLEQDLELLGRQLRLIESRFQQEQPAITGAPKESAREPIAKEHRQEELLRAIAQPARQLPPTTPTPPSVPPVIPTTIPSPQPVQVIPIVHPAAPTAAPVFARAQPEEKRSFEMRLGTYWLVRIGIVMLLTGMVFFGNYAYQNFIVRLGAGGKISLLYLAGALLLGAGAWWQRKAVKESLKNYAQVLFAGGLALVYFTTYAAHHIENLRVIESPLLDGAVLLAWAGFMVWIADRKKSEVLALFAVGLAYYTSVITRVGSFTLYSNLLLTIAAVFFLVRNRWAGLTFASLVATYAAYGFWRFFDGSNWHWASPGEGLWHGTYFLMSYWIVFTSAVFLSKHEQLRGTNRATFLTLNNCEFFVMFLLTMLQVQQGDFWKFSLCYGAVLLAFAELARRTLSAEPLTKNSYLTQGLLLVTIGVIAKYTGLKLALLLGAESVMLFTLGSARRSLVLQIGSYLCGALAVGYGIDGLERDDMHGLLMETAVGSLMVFNAFWSHRQLSANKNPMRPVPAFFSLLALITCFAATWYNTSSENLPLVLAAEALVFSLSVYMIGVRELSLLGQAYLLLAHGTWLFRYFDSNSTPPWWNPLLVIAITVALTHWRQRQRTVPCPQPHVVWQSLYALAVMMVLYLWLEPLNRPADWLTMTSLIALAITVYGVFTRAWMLAACAQIFLFISIGQFALQLANEKPAWHFPLAPVAVLGTLSFATVKWFQKSPDASAEIRDPLLQLAMIYRWLALAMSLWWISEYIPAKERIWVSAFIGLLIFLWAGWRRNSEALLFSAAFTLFGFGMFWVPLHEAPTVYLPNLFAILALLAQQRLAKKFAERYKLDAAIHGAAIIVGGLTLWLLLHRWLRESASTFYLTAAWSALALVLFGCGMLWRERVYRWVGLGVLATALGRVFIFDVWKLETIYRILSFMALGIVLLVLGFIYNKYQEKIKEWL